MRVLWLFIKGLPEFYSSSLFNVNKNINKFDLAFPNVYHVEQTNTI